MNRLRGLSGVAAALALGGVILAGAASGVGAQVAGSATIGISVEES